LPNQLFALVTQTTRGEVAVVNLSSGAIIDESHTVPGLNFLPVGANPTDIATTPDGRMAFVSAAEPNKFAIYGIPGERILGDQRAVTFGLQPDPERPAELSSWPVCVLPQRPGSLTVVPRRSLGSIPTDAGAQDAGAEDAGTEDAGAATAESTPPYELVAVLPGDRTRAAKIVTIDPRPFLRASQRGQQEFGLEPKLVPGELQPCPITAAMELVGESAVPASFEPGPVWGDGVQWVDGGVDLSCETPEKPSVCGLRPCKCRPTIESDAGVDDAGACAPDVGPPQPSEVALELGPLDPPQPVAIARDDQTLYVADTGVPLIHVVDLSVPGAPRELPPLVVSSLVDPSRTVSIRELAISPATREYKRYLYAVDRKEGSIAVFDVTDPAHADRNPMRRPHPELNPFQPPDRIAFVAPVVAIAFARHDFPVTRFEGAPLTNAKTGVLCNPNPNVNAARFPQTEAEFGAQYRADSRNVDVGLGPARLRGVFAFATLSNGQIVTIDVDDWDAPCRRPVDLTESAPLAHVPAQPAPSGPEDVDPYHAPTPAEGSTTGEVFFPVVMPHRPRSTYFLRDDTAGRRVPFMASSPTISSIGAVPPPLFGAGSEATPRLRPTSLSRNGDAEGTTDVGVRFSLDTPEVHFDQDWSVTYEGTLPGFEGLPATVSTTDGYSSLVLSQPQARFCAKGVEDWSVGGERANAITNALAAAGRPGYSERLDRRMVDYVQITNELLGPNDPYWQQPDFPAPNGCWPDELNSADLAAAARGRYEVCANIFGPFAEQRESRDFPILEAYDDHLVLGRFAQIPPNQSREVVYSDPSNATTLKMMRCCFQSQVTFNVRTGSQWVTVGSTVGLLSHLTRGDGGRCVPSCEPREALLNSRAPSLPFGAGDFAPFRDSPLALRNPAFSFFVQNGEAGGSDEVPARDVSYHFQTRGGYQALVIDIGAQTRAVNPQSMRFLESLGQIAVVDGASQGLVLLDLRRVRIAREPYF
ncbi:MAG TPA: hypothetical protein VM580_14230, partial [Labilithrix sp.]|nr:hypothetical protein [Labilithrix sp.]